MQKEEVNTIVIDKFEFVCSGLPAFMHDADKNSLQTGSITINDFTLCNIPGKLDYNYHYVFQLMHRKEIIGTYKCGFKNWLRYGIQHPSYFETKKNILYKKGFENDILSFLNCFGLEYYKCAKLEIAVDGHNLLQKHNSLMNASNFKRVQPLRSRSEHTNEITNIKDGITLGSKGGDKHISIYDKQSLMIKQGEQFIQEFWEHNGLYIESGKQIDRVELRMSKKQAAYFTNDLSLLSDAQYLASFFKQHGSRYLEFYEIRNREIRKQVIDWSELNAQIIKKPSKVKDVLSNNCYRPVIKHLYIEFRKSQMECYRQSYEQLASSYRLTTWLVIKIPFWEKEFLRMSA